MENMKFGVVKMWAMTDEKLMAYHVAEVARLAKAQSAKAKGEETPKKEEVVDTAALVARVENIERAIRTIDDILVHLLAVE